MSYWQSFISIWSRTQGGEPAVPSPAVRAPLAMDRPPITVEAAGLLARAKRRKDYCHVFIDFDSGQWYTAERDDMSPGIQLDRAGRLRFACAQGSVMATNSYTELWYHLHGGLSVEQDIYGISFDWRSLGTMTWEVYETDLPIEGASWTLLGTGGGSTHASPATVNYNCAAGQRGLAVRVKYAAGKTLSVDEWVEFSDLRVRGQSGDISIGAALSGILVASGLATSYSSVSVP
jgi:hypothetical protein